LPFEHVLESAIELGAPTIRVWAGAVGSAAAGADVRVKVTSDLNRIAAMAAGQRITISLEFHNGTLTDTADSTVRLLHEVAHPNLFTYWQPPLDRDTDGCVQDLKRLLPWVTNLHVYHWKPSSTERLALGDGAQRWALFLDTAAQGGGDRYAMLEFVERDSPECFLRDAATLKEWVGRFAPRAVSL
jgi:sugar phosphate isomerase/epimerase